jgi:O-antigen/teichoic acid export membrane protein
VGIIIIEGRLGGMESNSATISAKLKVRLGGQGLGAYGIVILTALIVNLTGYIFVVVVARFLGPSDYSALAALLALAIIVVTGICGPLQTVITRYVSADTARGLDDNARYLVRRVFLAMAAVGGGVALVVVATSWLIKSWLGIDTLPPVLLLALTIGCSFILPVTAGAVLGMQRFFVYGVSLIAGAIVLVTLGIGLVALGLKVSGAMIAEVISVLVTVSVLAVWVRKWLGKGAAHGTIDFSHLKRFAPVVVVASTCLTAFIYIDVFLVRGLIGGAHAGYYAGAQKLGTVVYLLSGVFAIVMFPRVIANKARGVSSWGMLARVEAVVAVACGATAVLLATFPDLFLRFTFGGKYTPGVKLVPIFALAMFFFSLQSVCVTFLLAIDRFGFVFILASGVILETVAIILFHGSMMTVAWIVALVSVGVAALMGTYVLASWLSDRGGNDSVVLET